MSYFELYCVHGFFYNLYFLIKTKIAFISKKWQAWIILERHCLNPFFFLPARKNMYVQLLVILAMDLVTQHVIVTWYATWKKWNVEYWKKIIICLNYLVNVVLEELFEPFFILVINKKKIIFNFWMWFMICCFCMKSVKMQFKCLISDALGHGLIEVMERLWLLLCLLFFL